MGEVGATIGAIMTEIRKPSRHTFRYKIKTKGEKDREIRHKCKVVRAKKPVSLILTEEDVLRSIELHGHGNCQTCAMACSAKRQPEKFPHAFAGLLDWSYSKAHIVSKLDKKTGLPSECYAYEHHDNIAKLFDTMAGLKKLLKRLRDEGPITVNLRPIAYRPREGGRPRGNYDGSRAPRVASLQGARGRAVMAQLGGFVA
jgi:hypothetical protein